MGGERESSGKNRRANGRLITSKCIIYMNEALKELVVWGLGGFFFIVCFILFVSPHKSWVVLELTEIHCPLPPRLLGLKACAITPR